MKEMKKMSNRAAKTALKMHQNKYGVEFSKNVQRIQTHPGHLLVRRRRLILAYESLVRNIDKLNWVVDMDFAEDIDNGNLEFKKDRYSDFYNRIENLKEHISELNCYTTEETRERISKAGLGRKWANDGKTETTYRNELPDGFVNGRLPKRNQTTLASRELAKIKGDLARAQSDSDALNLLSPVGITFPKHLFDQHHYSKGQSLLHFWQSNKLDNNSSEGFASPTTNAQKHYRRLSKLDNGKTRQESLRDREREAWEKFDEELAETIHLQELTRR